MVRLLLVCLLLLSVSGVNAQDPAPGERPTPKDAEPLPEAPKASAESTLKKLLPDQDFYLETLADGSKRVLFAAEVCLREGPLEVFVCKKGTKEHESILRIPLDARYLHAALIASGAKPGKPVQYVKPDTLEPDYKAASGATITVQVHYKLAGKLHTHAAQDWILDQKTKKPMTHQWVFAGSRFMKFPDAPATDPEYYCANNGEVIGISNFPDSMLDLPVEVSKDDSALAFNANTEKIPPLGSKVWIIMNTDAVKKK